MGGVQHNLIIKKKIKKKHVARHIIQCWNRGVRHRRAMDQSAYGSRARSRVVMWL